MKLIFNILCFWLAIYLVACTPEENNSVSTPFSLQVEAEGFSSADETNTRASESGYGTAFSNGDKIGLIVLSAEGKLIDGMNNICYEYNGSNWVNSSSTPVYYYSNATYLAYYPYNASMDGLASKDAIFAAFTPKEAQSDYANGYTQSDLMITTGTPDLTTKTLKFSFTHLMAMLEFQFTQNLDGTASTVLLETGSTLTATSGGVDYQFCELTTEKCYRLLLKPSVTVDLNLNYTIGKKTYSYSETGVTMPAAGKYLRYNLSHIQGTEVEVSVGNYMGALGDVSKIVINSISYIFQKKANNRYVLSHLTTMPAAGSPVSIYINDTQEGKEALLLTTINAEFNGTDRLISVKLAKNGMEGEGSQVKPYQVTTPVQLRGVQEGQSNITSTGGGAFYYSQMNDIDISTYTTNWQSVKSGLLYDGQGYKIKNLNSTYGGIFSCNGGTIQNVHLESGTINSSEIIGGIVNSNHSQKLYNCSNGASVTNTTGHVGGMTGLGDWSIIEHCKNTGAISGIKNVGGIAGYCYGAKIRYCYNTGAIAGTDDACGGICATLGEKTALIEYCYNSGTITGTGNVKKGSIAGVLGFLGSNKCQYCWGVTDANLNLFGDIQSGAITTANNSFDSSTNQWPSYTTDAANGWGSAHWKSYANGEYPKLNWE